MALAFARLTTLRMFNMNVCADTHLHAHERMRIRVVNLYGVIRRRVQPTCKGCRRVRRLRVYADM